MKVEIQNVSKVYGNGYKALDDVTLDIGNGLFGLLGPNGAGKSSLMRILVTLQKHSSGHIFIDGKDIVKDRSNVRSMIGYLPQDFTFFTKLKTWEFLDYSARLGGLKRKERKIRVDEMLEKVGLLDVREKLANKLSGGMKRRLGIAQSLIANPKLVVVDEPTTGLDPEERIRFRNVLADIGEQDVTVILSTHIVGDISSTCKDIAVLNKGSLAFRGTPEDFIEKAQGKVWELTVNDQEFEDIRGQYPVVSTVPEVGSWKIQVLADKLDYPEASTISANLEHAYVYFMEHEMNITLR